MVAIGGISLPGCAPPLLRHRPFSPPPIRVSRFSDGVRFRSTVVLRGGVEKKGSRAVIVNAKVNKSECECETDLDSALGNGHGGNSDQPHQSKKLELEPSLPVLALVETTSFDSALYVMGVKAAAFPSSTSTADIHQLIQKNHGVLSTVGKSTNIKWHECSIGNVERQSLLKQKGCVIWITGLSGSGKSSVACSLSQSLYKMGKLAYILDGDNVRHGLNRDLGFKAEDRAENIRRVGEVAKLFADAGVICIASLISPYRRDRDACRAILPDGYFIEVFMDVPLEVCEARDTKGLYKLARAGKIKGFTGIDDPYEVPMSCEIVLKQNGGSPCDMAEKVMNYLEQKGFLQA